MTDETETTETEQPEAEAPEFPAVDEVAAAEAAAIEAGTLIKCKPWGKGQGAYVLVDAEAFDPEFHVRSKPLDHDGDGEDGGSLKGTLSTASKGKAKKVGK